MADPDPSSIFLPPFYIFFTRYFFIQVFSRTLMAKKNNSKDNQSSKGMNVEEHPKSQTHSHPSLEETIRMQSPSFNGLNSYQIIESEDSETEGVMNPLPARNERRPRATAPTQKKKKLSPDLSNRRPNNCPAPGTAEAKARTFNASLARCGSDETRAKFLKTHNLTAEDMESLPKENKPSGRKKRSQPSGRKSLPPSDDFLSGVLPQFRRYQPEDCLLTCPQDSIVRDTDVTRRRAAFEAMITEPLQQSSSKRATTTTMVKEDPTRFSLSSGQRMWKIQLKM